MNSRVLQRSWRDLRNLFLLEHCCREERNLGDGGGIQTLLMHDPHFFGRRAHWASTWMMVSEGVESSSPLLYKIHSHHWLESSGILFACECLFYHLQVRIISTLKNNMMNVCSLHWFKRFNTKPRLFLTLFIRKYIDVILFNFFFIIYKNDFTIFNFL